MDDYENELIINFYYQDSLYTLREKEIVLEDLTKKAIKHFKIESKIENIHFFCKTEKNSEIKTIEDLIKFSDYFEENNHINLKIDVVIKVEKVIEVTENIQSIPSYSKVISKKQNDNTNNIYIIYMFIL